VAACRLAPGRMTSCTAATAGIGRMATARAPTPCVPAGHVAAPHMAAPTAATPAATAALRQGRRLIEEYQKTREKTKGC